MLLSDRPRYSQGAENTDLQRQGVASRKSLYGLRVLSLPVIVAASSVHTPTQLFHDSSFAMKYSFNFLKMSSPVVLPSSG
jgi:hypothetical protein